MVDVFGEDARYQHVVLQCWINLIFCRMALNCSKVESRLSKDPDNTEISSWDLVLLVNNSAMFELTNAEKTRILRQTSVPKDSIQLLRLLLVVQKDHVEANLLLRNITRALVVFSWFDVDPFRM